MDVLTQLFLVDSVAHTVFILSLVVALGLSLGNIRFLGINLGVAGVLFAGLIFGHYRVTINHEVLEFAREFGLILFVYTIGLQVGPGFLTSLKREGLPLNLMAAAVVILGAGLTILISQWGHIPIPVAVGMFSGATTNTPSLAAAQQALKEIPHLTEEVIKWPGLGYAVAYPFGILGIILTMILTRRIFKIHPAKEAELYSHQQVKAAPALASVDLKVENVNLEGVLLKKIPVLNDAGVVISRVLHKGKVSVALPETPIFLGDILHAVGPKEKLEEIQLIIGSKSDVDLRILQSNVSSRRIIVTNKEVAGKSLAELNATARYGVTVTRISRAEIEFPASLEIPVHYADTLMVVGEETSLEKFAADVGNSPKELEHPHLTPIFVGVALGVILGSWPVSLPGMPSPVKLGLAGGPLIVAIVLSRVRQIGTLIWYMPISANFMLRQLGITLFLACVGLRSGDQFVATLLNGSGLYWMALAALITFLPIAAVALFARAKMGLNYMTICGLLAGSMTDPPALAFANSLTSSSAPSVAYATVYPLVMILRVLAAQMLVMFFMT